MWNKKAQRIIDQISDVQMNNRDLDNIAYYTVHLSGPKMWKRIQILGEAMQYHGQQAFVEIRGDEEGDQLWLPFDQQ